MRKELGKIVSARFGIGGYQDCMIGLSLEFSMKGSSVGTFIGTWAIQRSEHAKWSEEERLAELGRTVMKLAELLEKIRGQDVSDLLGIPVELTFDGQMLKDWRLLEEVL